MMGHCISTLVAAGVIIQFIGIRFRRFILSMAFSGLGRPHNPDLGNHQAGAHSRLGGPTASRSQDARPSALAPATVPPAAAAAGVAFRQRGRRTGMATSVGA